MKGPTAPKDPEKRRPFLYYTGQRSIQGQKRRMAGESSLFMKMMAD